MNNAVARVPGPLWIAALSRISGLAGAVYTNPAQFWSSFTQISWICAAAFTTAAALATTFISRSSCATKQRPALIQTPVPHLACPIAVSREPGRT